MDIVLVPGLWLDGRSWDTVAGALRAAGHRPWPVTLPGMESPEAAREDVSIEDCIDAVLAPIDAAENPVVLVGHSAGAGLATAALDRRVGRVARLVLIGGFPAVAETAIMAGFPTADGGIALPEWSSFDDADLQDLDEAALDRFRREAIPSPAALATQPVHLNDDRRFGVPVTVVATEFSSADLRGWIKDGEPSVQEFLHFSDVTYIDLPTGHWPQLTRPDQLAAIIGS